MKRVRFARSLFALLLAFVMISPALAIQYGEPDENEHPYVGLVVFYDEAGNPTHRCSGTLLSETVFLTAGHCTFGAASAQVWFDAEVLCSEGYPFTGGVMSEPITHREYADFAGFFIFNTRDIGVVILDEPVVMSEYGVLPEPGLLDDLATKRGRQEQNFTGVGYGLQSVKPELQALTTRYQGTRPSCQPAQCLD